MTHRHVVFGFFNIVLSIATFFIGYNYFFRSFVGWKYKILSGENTIADISMKLLYWGDTYVVSYDETQNPLLVLMIVLAIDVANAPKKTEDIKRTVHHKTHYWL